MPSDCHPLLLPLSRPLFLQGHYRSWEPASRFGSSVDFAIASVACVLDIHEGFCRQARIVLGGVAPAPWRVVDAETALIGETITSETAAAAAMAATAKAKPLSRNEYKVALVKALIQRAVLQAAEER